MRNLPSLFIFVVVTILFSLNVITLKADDSNSRRIPVKTLHQDSLAFSPGEKLSYLMHYNWGIVDTDVGTAHVEIEEDIYQEQKCFHTKVYGKTTKMFDFIFKVREDFQSWFTCDSLQPLKFYRESKESKYFAKNLYIYHWGRDSSYIEAEVSLSKKEKQILNIPADKATFDLPSLFYFARNMDFDKVVPGVKHPMSFAVDDEKYDVYFILYGRENINVPGIGRVNTIRFGAKLLAGEVFTGKEDMTVWITDDDNRIPVYFEAPILVGTASGRLTEWSGLKHPFTSRTAEK